MKLKCEQETRANRDRVWKAFDDPDNLHRWQPTFVSRTLKSGQAGERGAVAELVYEENGRQVVLTETVTERRHPDFVAGTYVSRYASALIVNRFEVVEDGKTRWTAWSNFRFHGVMQFVSLFTAGSIRRRIEADMRRFRDLVESGGAS